MSEKELWLLVLRTLFDIVSEEVQWSGRANELHTAITRVEKEGITHG